MKEISTFSFGQQSLFTTISRSELAKLKKGMKLLRIRKGTELYREDTTPKNVYILQYGKVKIFQRLRNGNQQIVYIYKAGEMFGYRPLLCNGKHPASAQALEDCSVYVLPKEKFFQLLNDSPRLSTILLESLSHEFTVLVNHIASFAQRPSKQRIVLSLLILQEKYRTPDRETVEITLSRSDLASFAGTSQETVARVITGLKKGNILEIRGRIIVIKQLAMLHALLE